MIFQCAIPCFEALFPRAYNKVVLDLLWELAWFHALTRLRAHTDDTLTTFDSAVITLGKAVRTFLTEVCAKVKTRELPRETESRKRRQQAGQGQAINVTVKTRTLNMNTYKYHALADYPSAIRDFGTSDNYNTQTVSAIR